MSWKVGRLALARRDGQRASPPETGLPHSPACEESSRDAHHGEDGLLLEQRGVSHGNVGEEGQRTLRYVV